MTSFGRYEDVIIASCARWVASRGHQQLQYWVCRVSSPCLQRGRLSNIYAISVLVQNLKVNTHKQNKTKQTQNKKQQQPNKENVFHEIFFTLKLAIRFHQSIHPKIPLCSLNPLMLMALLCIVELIHQWFRQCAATSHCLGYPIHVSVENTRYISHFHTPKWPISYQG